MKAPVTIFFYFSNVSKLICQCSEGENRNEVPGKAREEKKEEHRVSYLPAQKGCKKEKKVS